MTNTAIECLLEINGCLTSNHNLEEAARAYPGSKLGEGGSYGRFNL